MLANEAVRRVCESLIQVAMLPGEAVCVQECHCMKWKSCRRVRQKPLPGDIYTQECHCAKWQSCRARQQPLPGDSKWQSCRVRQQPLTGDIYTHRSATA